MNQALSNEVKDEDWDFDQTDKDDGDSVSNSYQISYFPADFTLKGFLDKWDSGQLVVPKFQRKYVWDIKKASRLIESFLLGLPVPGVFLYKERKTNKLLVIDGQQRITSAVMFFKGVHEDKVFGLQGISSRWEGKTFSSLDESDQYQLQDAVLRATVVQQLDPDDDSSIYHIFERLNTGGMNLNPMEVRKCVYFGEHFELLEKLNALPAWREILGKPVPDKRLRDVEVVLRVVAMGIEGDSYEKPMKRFLNRHMTKVKHCSKGEARSYMDMAQSRFEFACNLVVSVLGKKPFHLRGRLNYAVTDSILGVLISLGAEGVSDLAKAYSSLLEDKDYVDACTYNTSDEKQVYMRLLKARAALSAR